MLTFSKLSQCFNPNWILFVNCIFSSTFYLQQQSTSDPPVCTQEVCFDYLGCFSQNYPWVSTERPVPCPLAPKYIDTSISFHSRDQNLGQEVEVYPNITMNVTGFNPNRRTVFITHGFRTDTNFTWIQTLARKYLEVVDANIFLVNWDKGADTNEYNYPQVVANTRVVGAILGRFGNYLIEKKGVDISNLHLIGHSLGAHTSAYAANVIQNATGRKVFRITGLDPAQPGFEDQPDIVRLSPNDADFVDVIHSDAKPFITGGLGYMSPLGHVDFYINKGYDQPKCEVTAPKITTNLRQMQSYADDEISCSHTRATFLFAAALDKLKDCTFIGHKVLGNSSEIKSDPFSCGLDGSDCAEMGLDLPYQGRTGSYQVFTSGLYPFCCYNYTVENGCKM